MLTITEYLREIFEKFEEHCNKQTENMRELKSCMDQLKNYSPILHSDGSSIYSNPAVQQLYLLKYAYTYGFEYLSMYNEFIENFADKENISVVSLGCGTMLDYWALAYMLDQKKLSRPIVKYLGIDAIKWNHSLETEVRDKDKKTFQFSQESFEHFFERQNNEFNTHDVYFFPKSISEFSDNGNGKSAMEMMLSRLSEIEKDTVYFCISLRKSYEVANDDIRKVQKIIDKLEEEKTGFRMKEVICITDAESTVDELKKKGLCVKDVTLRRLGKKHLHKDRNIWDTDVAKNIGGYPKIAEDDPIIHYIQNLRTKCVHNSPEKNPLCEGCREGRKHTCEMGKEQTMKKTKYICDLVMKFERR